MRLPIRRKLFLSHLFAVLFVSGSIGSYFYFRAERSLVESIQSRLENSAAFIGQVLNADELGTIRGPKDRASPVYARTLQTLRNLARTNPDIAFLYVMRHSNGKVYFVLDSDESEHQAAPGREYADHSGSLLRGFQRPSVDDRVYTDEWGAFMSGYSPIRNGNGEYLVGIDMRAEELSDKLGDIRMAGILSLGLSIVLALVFSRMLSHHVTRPVHMLIDRCRAIAQGDPDRFAEIRSGDELEQLVHAFNGMSLQLTESRAQAEAARQSLQHSRDLLELRVTERTQALTEANERLLHEVMERARAEEQLAALARSDSLTGLMNRRAMLEQLEYQASRARRTGSAFAVVLGDLDRFKSINDSFGHDAGDAALVATARCVLDSLRSLDMVARWGGEELLILLPDTELATALAVAERVRQGVAALVVPMDRGSIRLTMSLGAAVYGPSETVSQCIKRADMALYQAKVQGRDRVVAAPLAQIGHSA